MAALLKPFSCLYRNLLLSILLEVAAIQWCYCIRSSRASPTGDASLDLFSFLQNQDSIFGWFTVAFLKHSNTHFFALVDDSMFIVEVPLIVVLVLLFPFYMTSTLPMDLVFLWFWWKMLSLLLVHDAADDSSLPSITFVCKAMYGWRTDDDEPTDL